MRHEVTAVDTALAVGSGDVEVLATPRLITWMEYETAQLALRELQPGQTSVGTAVRIRHRLPTRVGDTVETVAHEPVVRDRQLVFQVSATNSAGQVIAEGVLERVIVDRARFLANVP